MLTKIVVMAILGYTLVLGVDLVQSADLGPLETIWSKVVDRLWDRDIPRRKKPQPKAASKPPPKQPAKRQKKVTTPRAELPAPSPEAYARESSPRAKPRAPSRPTPVAQAPAQAAPPKTPPPAPAPAERIDPPERTRLDQLVRQVLDDVE